MVENKYSRSTDRDYELYVRLGLCLRDVELMRRMARRLRIRTIEYYLRGKARNSTHN